MFATRNNKQCQLAIDANLGTGIYVLPQQIPHPVLSFDFGATFSSQGLPIGATLTQQILYGQALLNWTPTAAIGRF